MELKAYAKINLTLEVLGRRPDGYHEIATVLQTVELADELAFEPAPELTVVCHGAQIPPAENLALRAARLLQDAAGGRHGARITLEKRIPIAAGLGGGSSDAAAALIGLSRLWGLGRTAGSLASLASQLGSDVPFFLYGGTALAEGRGEVVTPLPSLSAAWLVLAIPPVSLANKTAALYRRLRSGHFTDGTATRRLVGAIRAGRPLAADSLFNAFEAVASEAFPGLDGYRERFRQAGAVDVHLAGSGPTLFASVGEAAEGEALRERCAALGLSAYVVKTVAAPV